MGLIRFNIYVDNVVLYVFDEVNSSQVQMRLEDGLNINVCCLVMCMHYMLLEWALIFISDFEI